MVCFIPPPELLALKFGTRLEVVNEMEVAHPSHVTCFSRGDIEFVTLTMLHKSVLYDSGK